MPDRKTTFFFRLFIMLVCSFFVIDSYAADKRISVNIENQPLKVLFNSIEKQTSYVFSYNEALIVGVDHITVKKSNATVVQILDAAMKDTPLTYHIASARNIVIYEKKEIPAGNNTLVCKGLIIDREGQPVIGATIRVKGTSIGTTSDVDGGYVLENVPKTATLIFSLIGSNPVEISANDAKALSVVRLSENTAQLEEVVVVGYGVQKKSDITGSVSRVNFDDKVGLPNSNIASSLQGAVAGLNIGQVNTAGGAANIEVRGRSTLNGNTNVLIVLDGIPYNGTMASLNPNDIESIDILKDASSKAIYGASAANGVLLITTRKGKQGKPTVNLSATFALQTPTKKLHPMNRNQKIESIYDYYWNQGGYSEKNDGSWIRNPEFDIASKIEASQVKGFEDGLDYDWVKAGTQDSYYMDYQVSVSQRTDQTKYYISLGWTDQEGYILNDSFDRKNARVNIESSIFPWMKIGTQTFGSFMDYSGAFPSLHDLYIYSPLNSPYDEDGNLIYQPNGTLVNPLVATDSNDRNKRYHISSVAYLDIQFPFLKGLSYRLNWGNNYKWEQHFYDSQWGANLKGSAYKNQNSTYDYTIDNILTYRFDIAQKHKFDITAVAGWRKQTYESTSANGEQFTDLSLGFNKLDQAIIQKINSSAWQEQYEYQMGRLNYNFDNRYLVTATLRRDGFSGFSASNRYALFPSAALGWVISNEKFFKCNNIDNLKLRVSYGSNGNLTNRYSSLSTIGSYTYVFGDGGNTSYGQYIKTMPSNLKWESTRGMNYGVDFSMYNYRLNVSIDYYRNNTHNLLWNVAIPSITGFTSILSNIGNLRNEGVEISVTGDIVRSHDWNLNLGLNFSRNVNKITKLIGDVDGDGKEDDLIANGLFVGYSNNVIYDYNVVGLWGTKDEKEGVIPSGTYVGCEKIEDLDDSGSIDATNDRKIIGSKDPSFRASLSCALSWKDWALSAMFNSIVGIKDNYLGNNNPLGDLANNSGDNFLKHNMFTEVDYWRPDNQDAEYRAPIRVPSVNPGHWKNRSFVRLQDLSLSYSLPVSIVKKLRIQGCKFTLTGKNLFTLTKWKGWDPETGDGLSTSAYPVMRSYAFGINLSF
jgi:tonB-linked outer membrane protein, susC/ragA family